MEDLIMQARREMLDYLKATIPDDPHRLFQATLISSLAIDKLAEKIRERLKISNEVK